MTLPSSPTVAAIQPGLGGAAFLNNVINAPMTFLLDKVAFRARCTTSTGFATGGVSTPWATVDEDSYGMWGPSQTPTPLANSVIVVQQPGWYLITTTISITGSGVAGNVLLPRLAVNGVNPLQNTGSFWEGDEIAPVVTSGQPQAATGSWEGYCVPGDQIVINTYLGGGSQVWNTTAGQESRLSILWRATI